MSDYTCLRKALTESETPSMANLHDIVQQQRDHEAALQTLEGERDTLIRQALAEGTSVVDLAASAGLTRSRIYQIRDGRR